MTVNDLRHTFGSELYRATGDLETVRRALGHSSIKATQIYAPLNARDSEDTGSPPHVDKDSDIDPVSISGTLLMLDDVTPHVAIVVQAVSEGKAVATTLSDEAGKYQFVNLKPGKYQVRCYMLNGYVY